MSFYPRIKVCGITRLQDALYCASLGIDALGFVFYSASKRFVNPEKAREIILSLPPFITTVGLFVNPSADEVNAICRKVPLQLLQFHGEEDSDFCNAFNRPYLKAIRVKQDTDFSLLESRFSSATALLYDSFSSVSYGGSGQKFNWTYLPATLKKPWILAGGLNAGNVKEALQKTGALNLDIASGVESSPGIKDKEKLQAFFLEVKDVSLPISR